ncbi:MAG: chaperone NapD [Colwellia sp.]|nr:chaperone NapD [Colwellia sp.]
MSIDTLINTANDAFAHKDEYHIASFVAQAMITKLVEVKEAITSTEGAEIHATSPEGKIVFTLEGKSQKSIGRRIDQLKIHTGLLNLSPVYHQYIDETPTNN